MLRVQPRFTTQKINNSENKNNIKTNVSFGMLAPNRTVSEKLNLANFDLVNRAAKLLKESPDKMLIASNEKGDVVKFTPYNMNFNLDRIFHRIEYQKDNQTNKITLINHGVLVHEDSELGKKHKQGDLNNILKECLDILLNQKK